MISLTVGRRVWAFGRSSADAQTRSVLTIKKSPILPPKKRAATKPAQQTTQPAAIAAAAGELDDAAPSDRKTARLAKRIAMSGLCSRREAEKYIESHDVMVNGVVVTDMATVVDVKRDTITVAGRALSSIEKLKVWMAHKLPGVRLYLLTSLSECASYGEAHVSICLYIRRSS